MIAVAAIGFGLAVGWLSGGTFHRLAAGGLRFEGAILSLFLAQGVARGRLPHIVESAGFSVPIWGILSSVLVVLLLANRDLPAMRLAVLGIALNMAAVLANGWMPVGAPAVVPAVQGTFYRQLGGGTLLTVFSDVMPIPGGWIGSLGDLLLVVGLSVAVIMAMNRASDGARVIHS